MHPTLKIAIASAALAVAMTATVNAQSSSGNVSGEAAAGGTVTGVDTGFKRELKIDKDGKYQIRRVPTGDYQVVRTRKDGSLGPVQSVSVRVGRTARVMEPAPAKSEAAAGT